MDKLLQQKVEQMFIKQDCDRTKPNIQASVISAAANMARYSNIISYSDALEVLLEAFGIGPDSETYNMVGMNSSFVKSNIGFSVEFEDLARGMVNYEQSKDAYDELYNHMAKIKAEKIQATKQM